MEDVFSAIYQLNAWGSPESPSGPGSTAARAADFAPDLVELLQSLKVSALLDAPCGIFTWASSIADAVDLYIGVDVVREIVERNQQIAAGPSRTFLHRDLTADALPGADLVLCRDCLVHFSIADIWRALRNLQQSGSRLLLTTTFIEHDGNADIVTGGWRPLNLQREPFCLPAPIATVDERCRHSGDLYADKRLALWDLSSLPST